MDFAALGTLVKEAGPWVALCAFFVWTSWKREDRMAKRLDMVQDRDGARQDAMVAAIRSQTAATRALCDVLRARPCLIEQDDRPAAHAHAQRAPLPTIPNVPSGDTTPPRGNRVIASAGMLMAFLLLAGCGAKPANPVTDKRPVPAQTTRAEAAPTPLDQARERLSGVKRDDLMARLIAERDVLTLEKREAEQTVAQKQAALDATERAITAERQRQVRMWSWTVAALMGAVALVCIGLAVWLPILRKRMLVGAAAAIAVAACAMLFAALVPYLLWIGIGVGVLIAGVVIADLMGEHKLSRQLVTAVGEVKEAIPDYRARFGRLIDSDVDRRIDAHRRAVGGSIAPRE